MVVENNRQRSCGTSRSRQTGLANQPDIIVTDNQKEAAVVIEVPSDSNIKKKDYEKLEKYQGLSRRAQC